MCLTRAPRASLGLLFRQPSCEGDDLLRYGEVPYTHTHGCIHLGPVHRGPSAGGFFAVGSAGCNANRGRGSFLNGVPSNGAFALAFGSCELSEVSELSELSEDLRIKEADS